MVNSTTNGVNCHSTTMVDLFFSFFSCSNECEDPKWAGRGSDYTKYASSKFMVSGLIIFHFLSSFSFATGFNLLLPFFFFCSEASPIEKSNLLPISPPLF
nr:hypothetical protein Q903MT_gene2956 [Picea sitchensis]